MSLVNQLGKRKLVLSGDLLSITRKIISESLSSVERPSFLSFRLLQLVLSAATSKVNFSLLLRCSLFSLLLCSCSQKEKKLHPAFYHWQTHLAISDIEQRCLDELEIEKLYVKFFDVDWDAQRKEAVPLASLLIDQKPKDTIEIIPTVFITNRTFSALSKEEMRGLSEKVYRKINRIWTSFSKRNMREVQFDCDWTKTTKEKYFLFLKQFRQLLENDKKACLLSATIRLHQIKYADRTGVPPVDRGMLMFYNMGKLKDFETSNSILDLSLGKQYIGPKTSYSLPLDMALPVFRWGVLFRNGEMIKLINNLDATALQDTSRFVSIATNQYEVNRSTYLKAYYLYARDVIRLESVSLADLKGAAKLLNTYFENNEITVSFYHLDTTTIKHYTYEELEGIYQEFRD